jgi:hypothetical protein
VHLERKHTEDGPVARGLGPGRARHRQREQTDERRHRQRRTRPSPAPVSAAAHRTFRSQEHPPPGRSIDGLLENVGEARQSGAPGWRILQWRPLP